MNLQTRTHNSIRNIIFGLANQVIVLLLNFVSRTVFIRVLGAEYLGINGLFLNIVTVLSLMDLGIGNAMVYSFYKPIAKNDHDKIAALISFYKKMYNLIALLVLIIGIMIIPILNLIVKTDNDIPLLKLYYILFLFNTVLSYLFVYKSSIITADQKQYLVNMYSSVFTAIKTIAQLLVLLITGNYILYLVINFMFTFINNIAIAVKADKMYPFIRKKSNLEKFEKISILNNIKSMFLYKICGVLLNGTDNIIISMLVGTIWVGYYSNYSMLITAVSNFITIVFTSMYASIGNMVQKSDEKRKYEIFNIILMIGFWITIISTSCFSTLINDFIELWAGREYVFDNHIVIAIIINFYLFCVLNPIWSFRDATGLFKKTKYIMLFTAVINIVLSIILGKIFGVFGVLISTAISRLVTYFWYEPVVLYKDFFGKSSKEYFGKQILFAIVTITSVIICLGCGSILKDVTWINLIIKTVLCFIVSNLCFIVINMKTDEFKYIFKKLLTYISKS